MTSEKTIELRGENSSKGYIMMDIITGWKMIADELDAESVITNPDREEVNYFIKKKDLINQLSNSGITPEELNSKSNAELKLLLAKRQLEG